MANIHMTEVAFTRGTLMNLGGYLNVARNLSPDYSSKFGNQSRKIGDTFNVRKPQRFEGTRNAQYTPEDLKNIFTPITVDKRFGIHFEWGSVEKALSLQDAQERYFKPAAIRIAHAINADAADYASNNIFNHVGTPGVVPGAGSTSVYDLLSGVYLAAGDKIVEQGLPEGEELKCIISRKMSSVFVGRVSGLFSPQGVLDSQYKKGWVDPTQLGYRWFKDQGLHVHTAGTLLDASNNTVIASVTAGTEGNNGTQSVSLSGMDSGATIKAGDWFTVAGRYAVHPQYRTRTGQLQQFKVMADATAAGDGTVTLTVFPQMTHTGQYQNIDSAVTASDAVLFDEGTTANVDAYASVVSRMGLLLHKNAFAFVSVPFEGPDKGMGATVVAERDPDTGINLRLVRAYDADLDREITRLDTGPYGFGRLYAELACNILSAA